MANTSLAAADIRLTFAYYKFNKKGAQKGMVPSVKEEHFIHRRQSTEGASINLVNRLRNQRIRQPGNLFPM